MAAILDSCAVLWLGHGLLWSQVLPVPQLTLPPEVKGCPQHYEAGHHAQKGRIAGYKSAIAVWTGYVQPQEHIGCCQGHKAQAQDTVDLQRQGPMCGACLRMTVGQLS